jgi:hypothetical protein
MTFICIKNLIVLVYLHFTAKIKKLLSQAPSNIVP